MQYGFYFDADRCGSCKACVMACKDKNDTLVGLKYRSVIDYVGGTWEDEGGYSRPQGVFAYSVSIACNHCADPACVAACPTGAMTKREDDGVVYVDRDVCVGCGACAQACPYGAPRLDEEYGVMGKCDMCREYIDAGGRPACVDACLMRCLDWGDIEDLREKYGDNADIEPLASSELTHPSIVIHAPERACGQGAVNNAAEELI